MIPDRLLIARSDPEWRALLEQEYGVTVRVCLLSNRSTEDELWESLEAIYYDTINDPTLYTLRSNEDYITRYNYQNDPTGRGYE